VIRPEELRQKAANLYQEFLGAWLAGEAFFPRTIPANRKLDPNDHAGAVSAIQALRSGSKEVRGFGYSIEWRERRSQAFGRNQFPERFFFETQDDYLRFLGKQSEFATFVVAVERLRSEFPEIDSWMRSHRQTLSDVEPALDGLLEVLRFFRASPRPGCFARELPLSVDTKFIERHERILREWFDLVLPPSSIRSDETHFGRRFGLRYPELHVVARFLDSELQREVGSPWAELSLPIYALAELPVRDAQVIIVENKVNLLTLPPQRRTIGLGALGRAVSELRAVRWLATSPVTYWGDLDVEGFEILSALRAEFPNVRSILMDDSTLTQYQHLALPGTGNERSPPPHLTADELLAFNRCVEGNIRVEQERIQISPRINADEHRSN
jgi:hypothetical protein